MTAKKNLFYFTVSFGKYLTIIISLVIIKKKQFINIKERVIIIFFKKSRKKIINIDGNINNEVVIKCALENLIEVSKVKVDLNN